MGLVTDIITEVNSRRSLMIAPPTKVTNVVVELAVCSVLVAYTLISTSWNSENHYETNNEL
jgi:hypothetical protein